jgi:hypothetical protein
MMNSFSTGHDSSDPPQRGAGAQNPQATVDPASVNTSASSHDEQNPLWLIAGAMVLFFVVAAAFLAAG